MPSGDERRFPGMRRSGEPTGGPHDLQALGKAVMGQLEGINAVLQEIRDVLFNGFELLLGGQQAEQKIQWDEDGTCSVCSCSKVNVLKGPTGLEDLRQCQGCQRAWKVPCAGNYISAIMDMAEPGEVPRFWSLFSMPDGTVMDEEAFTSACSHSTDILGMTIRVWQVGDFLVAYAKGQHS